jgi:hypothetical protein
LGSPSAFGEHGWVGVEADHLLEQVGESDREDAGSAAGVEEPSLPSRSNSSVSTASSCGE